jgi:hypothetical protein
MIGQMLKHSWSQCRGMMCTTCHPYAKYTSKCEKISPHQSLCTLFTETPLSIYCVPPCKSMISPMTAALLPWESEPKCLQSPLLLLMQCGWSARTCAM